jgi:hypothetical protein
MVKSDVIIRHVVSRGGSRACYGENMGISVSDSQHMSTDGGAEIK